jgi:hypothetical protein
MIDQLLCSILDLIIGMKQMNMFLDDPLRVFSSISSATSSRAIVYEGYPSSSFRSAISSSSFTILGSSVLVS